MWDSPAGREPGASGWGGLVTTAGCYWAQPWGLGGVASTRFTAVPRLAVVPAAGVWRMTVPGSKLQLPLRVMVPVMRPALVRVPWAWLSFRPVTAGTVTTGGKSQNVMVTGGLVKLPAGGVVAMMVPLVAGPQPPPAVVTS